MIRNCPDCSHKPHPQDSIHGPRKRVFNEEPHKLTCTVCGHEVKLTSSTKQSKENKS